MSFTSIYRSRGILSLCVVLSMALVLQGAPASRSPDLQRSERNSAPIHPKSSGKVDIPILPPDENMDTMLEKEQIQEYDIVSGDGHVSGIEPEEISGDDSVDYTHYLIPDPEKKSTILDDAKPGDKE